MAKTVVTTGYDDAMADVGDLTTAGKRRYASRYGHDFVCKRLYADGTHPSWQKLDHIIRLLTEYDTVIWMDADSVVTNPDVDILKACRPGLNVSKDWNDAHPFANMSLSNFVATREAMPVLVAATAHADLANRFDYDQGAVRRVYDADADLRALVTIHPRRVFNAVDSRLRDGVIDPWQPGDWVNHLTSDDAAARGRIARELTYVPNGRVAVPRKLVFSHGGALGDIVCHLPVVRDLGGGDFYVIPNTGKGYQTETDMQYRVIRPLLECQPYIAKTGWGDSPTGICFDGWRHMLDFSKNLTDQACKWIGLPPYPGDCPPWLTVPDPLRVAEVVFARATRNLFPGFPWKAALDRFKGRCVFLGLPYEYRAFVADHGFLPYYPTENYLAAARVIKGSNLLFGSASGLLAVAEGLKHNCVASSFPVISHCVFYDRPGQQHCWDKLDLDRYSEDGKLLRES